MNRKTRIMQPLSLLKDLVTDSLREVEFVGVRCLRKRLNKCECLRCIDSCSAGSLSLKNNQIEFDSDTCSGCMRCLAVCPSEAFLAPEYDLDKQFKSLSDQNRVIFSCPRQNLPNAETMIVPCMGMFSIELLFFLGMTGPPLISFNVSNCHGCVNKSASDLFLKSLGHLETYASALLNTRFIVLAESAQEKTDSKDDRRYFISTVANHLISATSPQLLAKPEIPGEPASMNRWVPQKTQLTKLLLELADNESKDLLLTLCTHQVSINRDCTLCPLCTGICPTGALKIEGFNEGKQLMFNNSRCSGCELCVTFCKNKAISLKFPQISETIHTQRRLRESEFV